MGGREVVQCVEQDVFTCESFCFSFVWPGPKLRGEEHLARFIRDLMADRRSVEGTHPPFEGIMFLDLFVVN